MPSDLPPPPASFRRRLLAAMLVTGLVPLVLLGFIARQALEELLSVSLAPVEQVLEEVSAGLAREGHSQATLDEARLNLAQAELARRALARRMPWLIAALLLVSAAVAHELRNPLTGMKLALARLSRGDAPPDATRLTESVSLLQEETSPVPVELQPGPEPSLSADPDGLRRLFGNLLKNATEASVSGAAPVRCSIEALPASVRVSIRDGGSGIPGVLEGPALTRGLFSTKPEGSGLGLPIAQKIVHAGGAGSGRGAQAGAAGPTVVRGGTGLGAAGAVARAEEPGPGRASSAEEEDEEAVYPDPVDDF